MTNKVCFENFYGKAFGTSIWDIGSQLSLKIQKNVIIFIKKALKSHSSNYVGDNVGKVIIVFTICFFIAKKP